VKAKLAKNTAIIFMAVTGDGRWGMRASHCSAGR